MSSILPLCVSVTLGLSMAMADNAGLMSYTLSQKKSESPHTVKTEPFTVGADALAHAWFLGQTYSA